MTWGENETQFFYSLTPDVVLEAAESAGLRCTGRCTALNSFENRVYDIELEEDSRPDLPRRLVAKFYRPGRWSEAQILEEHEFLADLVRVEVPVVAPLAFGDGTTLKKVPGAEIWFTLFPRVGGRAPEDFVDDQLRQLGRLIGRMHTVGASREAKHRVTLTVESYGEANLAYLLSTDQISSEHRDRYVAVAQEIFKIGRERWPARSIRIHGDCHPGNLLWNGKQAFFLDFDDMVRGPSVQDLWLLLPGRDPESLRQREVLVEGYCEMASFDPSEWRIVEVLRSLRMIHFSAWIAKRWSDPAFPRAFPEFGSHRYWGEERNALEDSLRLLQGWGQM